MGKYYGCVMKTSPWYVRASFQYREDGERWIAKQPNPNEWDIIVY